MKKPIHINIVGQKKSGKTTLIQSLIHEMVSLGISVGTVKHTSHDHEFDIKGTDSWKHQQAGSQATVIISPSKLVCHINEPTTEETRGLIEIVFQNYDIILWEGDRNTENDKIECIGEEAESLFNDDDRLIAVVTDITNKKYSNLFSFQDIQSLVRLINEKYGLKYDKD